MIKDLERLKEAVSKLNLQTTMYPTQPPKYANNLVIGEVINLIDQVELPEKLSAEWIRENEQQVHEPNNAWWVESEDLENLILECNSKNPRPEIPLEVAEWLEAHEDIDLYETLNILHQSITEIDDWYVANTAKFVEAKLNGYTVVEELYYVKMPNTREYLSYSEGEWYFDGIWFPENYLNRIKQRFTEKELKELNKIYWDMSEPI